MEMMLSSHAGALADSSWTKGFVCSLDKQETSRSLASCLSLSLPLLLKHKDSIGKHMQTQTDVQNYKYT